MPARDLSFLQGDDEPLDPVGQLAGAALRQVERPHGARVDHDGAPPVPRGAGNPLTVPALTRTPIGNRIPSRTRMAKEHDRDPLCLRMCGPTFADKPCHGGHEQAPERLETRFRLCAGNSSAER